MQDLRLIGVHEDGEHVLLSDAEGKRYRVALDEAMRAAARRDRPRLGQLQIEIDGGLRPRDVQALIRSGLSTEEVADRAGWTVQKVQRFEGPVLAEREYVANQARAVVIGTTRPRAGSGRSAGVEQTLGSRADERLKSRGVAEELVRWDSARLDDGQWTVTATFPAGGRERSASWRFDPRLKSLVPGNDEARWLSEEASGDSAIPTPHVATNANRASAVFDVEAEGGVAEGRSRGGSTRRTNQQSASGSTSDSASGAEAHPESSDSGSSDGAAGDDSAASGGTISAQRATSREPIDLMAAMREQSNRSRRGRGRRRTSPTHTPVEDSPRDDALPIEELVMDPATAPEPPAARGEHPVEAHLDDRAPAEAAEPALADDDSNSTVNPATNEANADEVDSETHADSDSDSVESASADSDAADSDAADSASDADGPDDTHNAEATARGTSDKAKLTPVPNGDNSGRGRKSSGRKGGRPSVPSWDDIMFGGGRGNS
ncbi:septation protein SepH [Knoellia subterranea]|uniref:DNA-binding protein n=1 Tax=Knoellia subterranea KCTC 19937 TaxID=1385521 RepID=A0A0A0JP73_9MICO|nr:septation protein SepH [Knoellia subterranea]KGN38519.1 DNA-binding protein [Knoellia subterranea KCTC 19937]